MSALLSIMSSKLILIFKNVLRFKLMCVIWFSIVLCFCVIYIILNQNEPQELSQKSSHVLCLLVPFRDRFEELLQFVPYMSEFLNRQGIRYYISVINQVDIYRFNRAALINAGFLLVTNKHLDCDYFGMNDIDLLPLNDQISYKYPENFVFHVASPDYHPRYYYKTFIGGIVLMANEQFRAVNGMSNLYWGWGFEDDDLYLRFKRKSIAIKRPVHLTSDRSNTFRHIHGSNRKRDTKRCANQHQANLRRNHSSGLSNANFEVSRTFEMSIDGYPFTLHNINLKCDRTLTPWCICE